MKPKGGSEGSGTFWCCGKIFIILPADISCTRSHAFTGCWVFMYLWNGLGAPLWSNHRHISSPTRDTPCAQFLSRPLAQVQPDPNPDPNSSTRSNPSGGRGGLATPTCASVSFFQKKKIRPAETPASANQTAAAVFARCILMQDGSSGVCTIFFKMQNGVAIRASPQEYFGVYIYRSVHCCKIFFPVRVEKTSEQAN